MKQIVMCFGVLCLISLSVFSQELAQVESVKVDLTGKYQCTNPHNAEKSVREHVERKVKNGVEIIHFSTSGSAGFWNGYKMYFDGKQQKAAHEAVQYIPGDYDSYDYVAENSYLENEKGVRQVRVYDEVYTSGWLGRNIDKVVSNKRVLDRLLDGQGNLIKRDTWIASQGEKMIYKETKEQLCTRE